MSCKKLGTGLRSYALTLQGISPFDEGGLRGIFGRHRGVIAANPPQSLAGRAARCIGQPFRRRAACRTNFLLQPFCNGGKCPAMTPSRSDIKNFNKRLRYRISAYAVTTRFLEVPLLYFSVSNQRRIGPHLCDSQQGKKQTRHRLMARHKSCCPGDADSPTENQNGPRTQRRNARRVAHIAATHFSATRHRCRYRRHARAQHGDGFNFRPRDRSSRLGLSTQSTG